MQEWLRFKDIFIYFTQNECKSLTAERFIKVKIYKKMTANDSISYLSYLNKLVDQHNNTYQNSICKKFFNAYYSPLTEKNWDKS